VATRQAQEEDVVLVGEWAIPLGATLGSSVRAKGILLELRARLPWPARKWLGIEANQLTVRAPRGVGDDARAACALVEKALDSIESLSITTAERHRWLKDGRLKSVGTRTVKLAGRARRITFHVFDPRHVADVLDRDLAALWREQDALAAAESRRRAAAKAAMARSSRRQEKAPAAAERDTSPEPGRRLDGWQDFESAGLLK
jgi:hypothetical protein